MEFARLHENLIELVHKIRSNDTLGFKMTPAETFRSSVKIDRSIATAFVLSFFIARSYFVSTKYGTGGPRLFRIPSLILGMVRSASL